MSEEEEEGEGEGEEKEEEEEEDDDDNDDEEEEEEETWPSNKDIPLLVGVPVIMTHRVEQANASCSGLNSWNAERY